jgi:hypothetical protein
MATEFTNGKTVIFTMEIGKMISEMAKESINGQTEINIKVNGHKIKEMVMVIKNKIIFIIGTKIWINGDIY